MKIVYAVKTFECVLAISCTDWIQMNQIYKLLFAKISEVKIPFLYLVLKYL